jgi:hypothetical protein
VKKTVFAPMKQVVEDMDKIARDLQDVKTILACIAYQQDDKCLLVPFDALRALPKGIELEISVDRIHNNYVFKCLLPVGGSVPSGTESASPSDPAEK